MNKNFSFRILVLLLSFVATPFLSFSQAESCRHNIATTYGLASYNSSQSIPSGLPGNVWSLVYDYNKPLKQTDDRKFYLFAQYGIGEFKNDKLKTDLSNEYSYFEFNVNANWVWQILNKAGIRNYVGGGFGIEGHYNEASKESVYHTSYGNWGAGIGISNVTAYKFRKLHLQNQFHMPILRVGYFSPYQTFLEYGSNDYLIPNAVVWLGNYRYVTNKLKLGIPYRNVVFTLSYVFFYQNSDVNQNKVKYIQHAMGLGVSF